MPPIDANHYQREAPLTPREILDKLGALHDAATAIRTKADNLKKEAKGLTESAEAKDATALDLLRCFRMGRPVYLLVDGNVTVEAPAGLELWAAADAARKAEAEQAAAARYVEPIHEAYGVGRTTERAFTRTLRTDDVAIVEAHKPGAWTGRVGDKLVPGGPWRSAAEAMLATLAATGSKEDVASPELGWNPARLTEKPKAEAPAEVSEADAKVFVSEYRGKRLGVLRQEDGRWKAAVATGADVRAVSPKTFDGRDEAMGEALTMAGFSEKDARPKWTPATEELPAEKAGRAKAKRPTASPHDGKTFRATYGEKTLAVAQVSAPGPWFAYVDGQRIGGEAGFPTPHDAERAAEANLALPTGTKVEWSDQEAAPEAKPAVAVLPPQAELPTTGADRASEPSKPKRRTVAGAT